MQQTLRTYIRANGERTEKLAARGEIIALVMCLAGVMLMMQRIPLSGPLMTGGILLLAFIYAFHGNFLREIFGLVKTDFWIFSLKASYMVLAVTALGILFTLQGWRGGKVLLLSGCLASLIFFSLFIYKLYFGTPDNQQLRLMINNVIVRMLPALLIVAFLIISAIHA